MTEYKEQSRNSIDTIKMTKAAVDRLLKRVQNSALKPRKDGTIARFESNRDIYIRVLKDSSDLTFYSRKAGPLGRWTVWRENPDWISELCAKAERKNTGKVDTHIDTKTAETMWELFEQYFSSDKFRSLKTHRGMAGQLKLHYLNVFGNTPWNEISRRNLLEWHQNVASKKKSSSATANRVLSMHYGGIKWIKDNLFDDGQFAYPRLQKQPETHTKRPPLPALQLRALWHASKQLPSEKAGAIIRLLILTGQREGAIAGLEWDDLRKEKNGCHGWLTVPAMRSKGGFEYEIPIAPTALEILEGLYDEGTHKVFGTIDGKNVKLDNHHKLLCENFMRGYLQKYGRTDSEKTLQPWCFHNIRKNFRNFLDQAGVSPYTAEPMIGHKTKFTTGAEDAYLTRDRSDDMLDAMFKLEKYMMNLCEGDISYARVPEERDRIPFRESLSEKYAININNNANDKILVFNRKTVFL